MSDASSLTTVGLPGLLLSAAALLALAVGAVVLDGVLAARSEGAPLRPSLTRVVDETARLLRQRRRAPLSADTLVWLATLPARGPTGGFFSERKPIDW